MAISRIRLPCVPNKAANMRHSFLPYLSFFSDEDITYLFPTDTPWRQMPAYGAATAVTLAPTPTWDHHIIHNKNMIIVVGQWALA